MISLRNYRRAAVPLLAIQTADPAEIVRLAVKETSNGTTVPVLRWDCVHGLCALNTEAQPLESTLNGNQEPAMMTSNPVEFLRKLEELKTNDSATKAIIVALGMAGILDTPQVLQALWNLRDILPQQGILLAMTVPMGWRNPFPDDIAVFINPLPTREELIAIACKICKDAKVDEPNKNEQEKIGDALLGLSAFAAEQAVALSLSKTGINIGTLRERKRQQISETPGLSVYDGKETFADLGGLEEVKRQFSLLLKGKKKPGCIVFIDEGEKDLAGNQTDTSGVTQDQMKNTLTNMENLEAEGAIFLGPPGAAKSAFAKAVGNEGDILTLVLDYGGLKGSLVGESEARIRTAFAVITAVSGGRPFFIMTCNSIGILPPELKRRFTFGTFYFDLPTEAEKKTIWPIYLKKYNLPKQKLPEAKEWTGSEIKQCAKKADAFGISLIEASEFIIPVAVSAKEKIDSLRREASGRYSSASTKGRFEYNKAKVERNRNVSLD